MTMNNKYLCRVVTNIYFSYSKVDFVDVPIDRLREIGTSGISDLDDLLMFHKNILKNINTINFKDLLYFYSKISNKTIDYRDESIVTLKLYFENNNIKMIIRIINDCFQDKYRYLLMELLINTIYYRNNQLFLIIRSTTIDKLANKNSNEIIEHLENISFKYLKKRKILSYNDINELLTIFENNFKSLFKVKNCYLFGSYAKNKQDENSDLDLIIVIEDNKIDLFTLKLILKKYFKDKFDVETDIILKENLLNLTNFESYVLSYAKKLR